ncbi:hypothetical protein KGM_208666 [Danaus plexippus plexippus]|uniref:Dynein regulatory complex protein 9 n=1 Tax=Danaus plexippus plexippus TaxID=278856 RepID=A0A212FFZ0_DANPL|nr:hypothetical protein KGM_208666 [Danaus plexippus plexippus]
MDAWLFVIILEVLLLQIRILDTSAQRKFPDNTIKSKREKQLLAKLSQNRALEKIITELEKSREEWLRDLSDSDLKVAILRDRIKDRVYNARIQHMYADRWLLARSEALELRQQETTSESAPKKEDEDCVHNELLRAYELQIQEREDLLQYWMSRYSQDIVNIGSRLREKCEKLRITVARRVELEKLFALHEGEMRSWLTFKKERAARLAREERSRRAATRVQAWWRGVMVRRALGTFRYLRNVKKSAPKLKKK